MAVELTEGAITMITKGEMQAADVKPVLQVIGVSYPIGKFIPGRRKWLFPLVLTDGSFNQQAHFVTDPQSKLLKYGCIIRLKEYVRITSTYCYYIAIYDLEVIREDCGIIKPDSKICQIRPPLRSPALMRPIIHPTTTTTTTTTTDKMPLKETRKEGNKRLIEEPHVCTVCKKRKLMENESGNPDINHVGNHDRVYQMLKKKIQGVLSIFSNYRVYFGLGSNL